MRGKAYDAPIEWLEFLAQGEEQDGDNANWRVHVPFMLSSWDCMFGRGCPGHFGKGSSTVTPDIGCCTHGAWITSEKDHLHVRKQIALLTDEDWDAENRKALRGKDPLIMFKKQSEVTEMGKDEDGDEEEFVLIEEQYNGKTRVWQGGCVFANRNGGSTGKPGCAFVAMAHRKGLSHVDTMPQVCWQLPLRVSEVDDSNVVHPWDADEWGGEDDDNTHDSWMKWWCIDTPDSYCVSDRPLYKTMEMELRRSMGDKNYDKMVELLEQRMKDYGWGLNKPAMAVIAEQGMRPSLPLLIGNRTAKREGPLKPYTELPPAPFAEQS